ncbi:MAG: hypothetical protein QOE62_693 [Actinomycetota bacterium]|jgi:hypothetical protein|nr:hypothetical protein [Actinomycetota bacterium]
MSFATIGHLYLDTDGTPTPWTHDDRRTAMTFVDLESAANRMAELLRGIADDRLCDPTPCGDYTLAWPSKSW